MTDRELLELIATQVGTLTHDVQDLKKGQERLEARQTRLEAGQEKLESRLTSLERKVDSIEKTVIRIENDHGSKLVALFDGYMQNAARLDRIEKEVANQEEFVMRRIK